MSIESLFLPFAFVVGVALFMLFFRYIRKTAQKNIRKMSRPKPHKPKEDEEDKWFEENTDEEEEEDYPILED